MKYSRRLLRTAVAPLQSNWRSILFYTSLLLLFVGVFFLLKGTYGAIAPPVDRVTYEIDFTVRYNGSIKDILTTSATDSFSLVDLNVIPVSVIRYDRSSAPPVGVTSSTMARCSSGFIITIILDGTPYGPYCYTPDLISNAFWSGQTSEKFVIVTSPGPHTLKIFATYKNTPVFSKTYSFHAPTYDEAKKEVSK